MAVAGTEAPATKGDTLRPARESTRQNKALAAPPALSPEGGGTRTHKTCPSSPPPRLTIPSVHGRDDSETVDPRAAAAQVTQAKRKRPRRRVKREIPRRQPRQCNHCFVGRASYAIGEKGDRMRPCSRFDSQA
ncbi:hypothetical protein MRX96_013654 [Rhipicephalus microplus]